MTAQHRLTADDPQVDPEARTFRSLSALPGWVVSGLYREEPERHSLRLSALSLAPLSNPEAEVTAEVLRSLSLPALRQAIGERLEQADETQREAYRVLFAREAQWQPPPNDTRTRKRRLTDDDLRAFALAYLDEAGTRGVTARLAARFSLSPQGVKDRARAAERDGWLAGRKHGARGARPGPRLLAALEPHDPEQHHPTHKEEEP